MSKFPLFKSRVEGVDKKFDLTSPKDQKEYFELKAGEDIKKVRKYLKDHTFIAYLLGKKNSGKGTYSKMLVNLIGPDLIRHFSVGDMIRDVDQELEDDEKKEELFNYLRENYRGSYSVDEIIKSLEGRSTKKLLPTELILTLIKREVSKSEKKTLLLDGFPRNLNQVDFSLFFRDLIGYREDPDVFVLIDVPENVIDERIKWRKICPQCKTSRNLKLLPTPEKGFDEEENEFFLYCDNPKCDHVRMVSKEGDELGIENIKERLERDATLIKKAISLHGIPKILLRNSVPVSKADEYVDGYEITPEFVLSKDKETGEVKTEEKPWVFEDDNGEDSYSLMPAPVVLSFIDQIKKTFDIN
jgi:adenylate kinase family enzyme